MFLHFFRIRRQLKPENCFAIFVVIDDASSVELIRLLCQGDVWLYLSPHNAKTVDSTTVRENDSGWRGRLSWVPPTPESESTAQLLDVFLEQIEVHYSELLDEEPCLRLVVLAGEMEHDFLWEAFPEALIHVTANGCIVSLSGCRSSTC